MALGLAALALVWTIILSANLEIRVDRLARDVRRIADAVAPEPPVAVESKAMPERLNRVAIRTQRVTVEIPWASRVALIDEIRHLDSAKPVIAAFEAAGATRPVELDVDGMALVVQVIHVMSNNAGGMDGIPEGLADLRHALVDELDRRARIDQV